YQSRRLAQASATLAWPTGAVRTSSLRDSKRARTRSDTGRPLFPKQGRRSSASRGRIGAMEPGRFWWAATPRRATRPSLLRATYPPDPDHFPPKSATAIMHQRPIVIPSRPLGVFRPGAGEAVHWRDIARAQFERVRRPVGNAQPEARGLPL